jgi:hypothetical protein
MIEAKHEGFQASGPGIWNDSHFFSFFDENSAIEAICKVGVLPNQGKAHTWLVVWQEGELIDYRFDWNLPLPAGNIDDLRLGAFRIRMAEPLQTFRISARTPQCELDLLWHGIMPVFDYRGAQALADKVAPNHYQQAGRVTGEVTCGGSRHRVDGFGYRDRSWGERDFSSLAEFKAVQGQLGTTCSFMGMKFRTRTGALLAAGYLFDQGRTIAIADVGVHIGSLEFGTTSRQRGGYLTDVNGARFEWAGEAVGSYGYSYGQVIAGHEIVHFRIGDRDGWGWLEEGVTRAAAI